MSLLQSLVPNFNRAAASTGAPSSQTQPTVRPTYQVDETDDAYQATVQLPGVSKDGLEITSEEGVLTIVGRRQWKRPDGWSPLYRESDDASYHLALRHDATVAVDRIQAEIRDGVLRLTLPKSEAVKPRRIAVA